MYYNVRIWYRGKEIHFVRFGTVRLNIVRYGTTNDDPMVNSEGVVTGKYLKRISWYVLEYVPLPFNFKILQWVPASLEFINFRKYLWSLSEKRNYYPQ